MNEIEQWWNTTARGNKPKYLEKNLSHCHRQPQTAFVSYEASYVCYVCVPYFP